MGAVLDYCRFPVFCRENGLLHDQPDLFCIAGLIRTSKRAGTGMLKASNCLEKAQLQPLRGTDRPFSQQAQNTQTC